MGKCCDTMAYFEMLQKTLGKG